MGDIAPKMGKTKTMWIISAVAAGLVVGAGVFWYLTDILPERRSRAQEAENVAREVQRQLEENRRLQTAADTVASPPALPARETAPTDNPIEEKVPEINPVERANPFAEEFENPFE